MKITKSLLSKIYGFSSRTLSNLIEENEEIIKFWGIRNTVFTVKEQRIIFNYLGVPVECEEKIITYVNKVLA